MYEFEKSWKKQKIVNMSNIFVSLLVPEKNFSRLYRTTGYTDPHPECTQKRVD